MNREIYKEQVEEVSLNIVNTEVESVRSKNISKSAVRVFDKGNIGIAGALGEASESSLTEKAKANLELQIPYDYEIASGNEIKEEYSCQLNDREVFVKEVEELAEQLRKDQPGFVFSNKINMKKEAVSLENDKGLNLAYKGEKLSFELIIKEKGSPNILDAFSAFEGTSYDRDEYLRMTNNICDAFNNPIELASGEYPVFFMNQDNTYKSKLMESLNGLLYGAGTSLFAGKMGEKLFAENFHVQMTRNTQDGFYGPFFDFEGTVHKDYRFDLIKEGHLQSVITDKKTAAKYSLDHTGGASGQYDSVPSLGMSELCIRDTGKTMKELVGGEKALFVLFASGGDFTPDGKYASPVQLSYLFDGEKFVGKMPELNISTTLWDMFGKDFIGVSTDSLSTLYKSNVTGMRMKVDVKK